MTRDGVAVVGGGAWGTALALHMAGQGERVRLWIRETDLVARMKRRRDNPVFLPGVSVPESVVPTARLDEALDGADLVIAAVPSSFTRSILGEMAPLMPARVPVVLTTKGIEQVSLALPAEVAGDVLGEEWPLAVLSGPSFAAEVARGRPTAVVLSSRDIGLAARIQQRMSGRNLRLYTNPDVTGVQIGGALKNVIAIAAGAVDGLGMGHNTLAALVTRGLAEIRRLGVARGATAASFSGLAGLGDLVLTCTGELSRNRRVGQAIGRGERLGDILERSPSIAEGVATSRSARDLALRAEVEMPIVEEVHRILYEEGSPREAVIRLMTRPLTAEHPEVEGAIS